MKKIGVNMDWFKSKEGNDNIIRRTDKNKKNINIWRAGQDKLTYKDVHNAFKQLSIFDINENESIPDNTFQIKFPENDANSAIGSIIIDLKSQIGAPYKVNKINIFMSSQFYTNKILIQGADSPSLNNSDWEGIALEEPYIDNPLESIVQIDEALVGSTLEGHGIFKREFSDSSIFF